KQLDRLKDDFVSTVSHELRTPLTSIRAFTQILLEHPQVDAEQRSRFLGIITKETERLTRLINQVLDLSKIESGKAEWRESQVDLRELIGDAVTGMSQVFEEQAIKVDVQLPQKVPPVRADVDRIIQVMLNLLSNAAKFCEPGRGQIRVALQAQSGALRVEVRDNGPGIDPAARAGAADATRAPRAAATRRARRTGGARPIPRWPTARGRRRVAKRRASGAASGRSGRAGR